MHTISTLFSLIVGCCGCLLSRSCLLFEVENQWKSKERERGIGPQSLQTKGRTVRRTQKLIANRLVSDLLTMVHGIVSMWWVHVSLICYVAFVLQQLCLGGWSLEAYSSYLSVCVCNCVVPFSPQPLQSQHWNLQYIHNAAISRHLIGLIFNKGFFC